MRLFLCLVCAALISISVTAPAQAQSQTTQTGSVSKGTNRVFTFTLTTFGQVTASLSWDAPNAHLLMVLVCGSTDPQGFAIAAGLLDRFARFEAGVVPGEPCGLAVTSVDETANFRLHVFRSGDQVLSPSAVGSVALSEARQGTLISDEAIRLADSVKQMMLR